LSGIAGASFLTPVPGIAAESQQRALEIGMGLGQTIDAVWPDADAFKTARLPSL
jgi:hypothetical protein